MSSSIVVGCLSSNLGGVLFAITLGSAAQFWRMFFTDGSRLGLTGDVSFETCLVALLRKTSADCFRASSVSFEFLRTGASLCDLSASVRFFAASRMVSLIELVGISVLCG